MAIKSYLYAYNINPNNIDYIYNIASIYIDMNMLNDSYDMCLKIIKINESFDIYNFIGDIFYNICKYNESLYFYDKSMQIRPNKYSINQIVLAYLKLGNYKEGIIYCLKWLYNYNNCPIIYILLCILYMYIAEYNEANKCIFLIHF